jgi:hypothetical protein
MNREEVTSWININAFSPEQLETRSNNIDSGDTKTLSCVTVRAVAVRDRLSSLNTQPWKHRNYRMALADVRVPGHGLRNAFRPWGCYRRTNGRVIKLAHFSILVLYAMVACHVCLFEVATREIATPAAQRKQPHLTTDTTVSSGTVRSWSGCLALCTSPGSTARPSPRMIVAGAIKQTLRAYPSPLGQGPIPFVRAKNASIPFRKEGKPPRRGHGHTSVGSLDMPARYGRALRYITAAKRSSTGVAGSH